MNVSRSIQPVVPQPSFPPARSVVAVTVLLVAFGCSSGKAPPPQKKEPAVKHPMPKLDPASPGPAYFGTRALGLVVLMADGTFKQIPMGSTWVRKLAPGPKGTALACTLHECVLVEGDVVKQRWKNRSFMDKSSAGPSKFDHVAAGKDGALWVVDSTELAHYQGGKWTVTKLADALGSDVTSVGSLQGIAADGKGGVWIATHKYLFERSGDKWTKFPVTKSNMIWEAVVANTHGVVKALSFDRVVYGLGGAKPAKAAIASHEMVNKLAIGPKGELYAASSRRLLVTAPEGGAPTEYVFNKLKDKLGDARAIAGDDAGRVWVAADRGLHIIDREGKVTTWKTGSITALNSPVDAVLVLGGGPKLPTVGPVKTGGIAATVYRGRNPVAGARVEICTRPSSMLRRGQTPCSGSDWSKKTTTDANGRFQFTKVPLGVYGFAIKPTDDRWTVSFTDFGAGMKPDQMNEVGTLRLQNRRR